MSHGRRETERNTTGEKYLRRGKVVEGVRERKGNRKSPRLENVEMECTSNEISGGAEKVIAVSGGRKFRIFWGRHGGYIRKVLGKSAVTVHFRIGAVLASGNSVPF